MKRYKEYKDSGVEWIGEIPSHWKLNKLKREFEFSVGGTPASGNMDYYTSNEDEGYRWVNISDLNNKVISDTKSYVTLEGIKNTSMNLVTKGSLLFSFKLSVGQVAFIEKSMYTNEAIASFSSENNKNSLKYLYYAGPIYIVENANENIYGAKILNQELIKNADIVLPPKDEQIKIANYLDKKTSQIDNLISKKEELIETLKASRTKLISETVTKGLDKNVPMKDSGIEWIGEIPSHWSAKRLKNIANMFGGNAFDSSLFSDEGVQIIRIGNLYQNKLSLERQPIYCPYEKINSYKKYIITKGDILMSLTGTLGKRDYGFAILIEENEQFLLNQRVAKITHGKDVYNRYLLYILWSNSYLNQLFSKPSGTKQGNLSNEEILSIYIAFTEDLGEQKRIADYLDEKTSKIDILISKIEKQIELLKKAKQKLITEVVTGKIDVTNL